MERRILLNMVKEEFIILDDTDIEQVMDKLNKKNEELEDKLIQYLKNRKN